MKKLSLLLIVAGAIMGGCVYYPNHYSAEIDAGYYPYAGPNVGLSFYYPYYSYYPYGYYYSPYYPRTYYRNYYRSTGDYRYNHAPNRYGYGPYRRR